jgi:hypothetical protein
MVERCRPFPGLDSMQIWTAWISQPEAMVLPRLSVSPAAGPLEQRVLGALNELVVSCTARNPQSRPSIRQVLDRVRHVQHMYEEARASAAAAAATAASVAAESAAGS